MAIERKPLRTEVRDIIFQLISKGELASGQRIKEEALSAELGISRTPLREALFGLEAEGFVKADPARGFSVVVMTAEEVRELYPILWTLEDLALSLIKDLGFIDVYALVDINTRMGNKKSALDIKELDTRWHTTLLEPCSNRALHALIARTKGMLRRYEIAYMRQSGLVANSIKQHKGIIAAVRKGDKKLARNRLKDHWTFGMESVVSWLSELEDTGTDYKAGPGDQAEAG